MSPFGSRPARIVIAALAVMLVMPSAMEALPAQPRVEPQREELPAPPPEAAPTAALDMPALRAWMGSSLVPLTDPAAVDPTCWPVLEFRRPAVELELRLDLGDLTGPGH